MFEEIATMDFPFEGIPTVPPRKDMEHMAFFCSGCRWAWPATTKARAPCVGSSLARSLRSSPASPRP